MNALIECLDNYFNGNLEDAKRQAKRLGFGRLYDALRTHYGKGHKAAFAIVKYLKGKGTFQAAANAESKEKEDAK